MDPALIPPHCPLCAFQSVFWQPAPQYAATAHPEHFFSDTPVAPHDQQLLLGRGGSCREAADSGGEAVPPEDAGAEAELAAEAGAEAETEGPARCEGPACCEGPAEDGGAQVTAEISERPSSSSSSSSSDSAMSSSA